MNRRENWTKDAIVAAMRRFNGRYGHPPTAAHWNPPYAVRKGRPEYATRFHADGDYPYVFSVQTCFGSWNAALVAAGFAPRKKGAGSRRYVGDDPAVRPEAVRLYASGLASRAVAKRLGCSPESVDRWAADAGVKRTRSEAQRLRYQREAAA